MDNYHLTHDGKDWKLTKQHASRAARVLKNLNKTDSIRAAADFMQDHPGSLKIHKLDGRIQEERTYPRSADPKKSKG